MGKLKEKATSKVWEDDEIQWRTLQHNKSKDFVRRALNPRSYPGIKAPPKGSYHPRLPRGRGASHQMGWTTTKEGKHIAYPNIMYNRQDKKLIWPKPREAAKTAISRGEYIEFKTAGEADQFSRKYKRGTSIR